MVSFRAAGRTYGLSIGSYFPARLQIADLPSNCYVTIGGGRPTPFFVLLDGAPCGLTLARIAFRASPLMELATRLATGYAGRASSAYGM